jgi:hypothetical protein
MACVVPVALLVGCDLIRKTAPNEYYAPDRVYVEDVQLDRNGLLTIDYDTMAETLWYCPGVDVHWQQGDLFVSFVRTYLEKPGAPDVRFELIPPTGRRVTIDAPTTSTVHITDGIRDRVVWKDGKAHQMPGNSR